MDLPKWIKIGFLIIVAFSCFTCYARPDYNLPLFAFAYLLWDYEKPPQKTRLTYTFVFTFIIDFVWLIYWGSFWDSSVFDNSWASGVQTFVLVLSSLSFVVKFLVIAAIVYHEAEVRRGLSFTGAKDNLASVFSGESGPVVRR